MKINLKITILFVGFIFSLLTVSRVQARPGDLDTTFGNGGKIVLPIMGWLDPEHTRMQPDGNFLTIGYENGRDEGFYFRNTTAGRIDTAFRLSGIIEPEDFAVQNDGKILAVSIGSSLVDGVYRSVFTLYRFGSDGALDIGFGQGGVVITRIANHSISRQIIIQPDGKIIVAGLATENIEPYPIPTSNYKLAFARYNPDGTLDPDFGKNGTATSVAGFGCYPILLQMNGKLLCGNGFDLNRYNFDGAPDGNFGTNGIVHLGGNVAGLAEQSDGKIVASFTNSNQTSIKRYNSSGTADASFGTDGNITITDQRYRDSPAAAIAVQPNGKILAAGSLNGSSVITRYTRDGMLDNSFGTNGSVVTAFENSTRSSVDELLIQPDNSIVAAGTIEFGSYYGSSPSIVRYLGDPTQDAVAISGRVLTPDGRGLTNAVVTMTDSAGVVHTAKTSSFGNYSFTGVQSGETYQIAVSSKRYRFASQKLAINDSLTSLDLVAFE